MRQLLFLIIILVSFSCRKENLGDCFKGSGPTVTSVRQPGAFHNLKVFSKMNVIIKQGPEHLVEITAGRNLIGNIETTIENGTLSIDNRNTCNFVRGYKREISIVVTAPNIRRAENHGVGPMTIDRSFVQDTLLLRAESSGDVYVYGAYKEIRTSSHGNGDMYLNASCNSLFVFSFGTNFTFADSLQVTESAFLHTFSIGDCSINARTLKKLSYSIQGDGNIYYKGSPPVVEDFSAPEAKGRAIRQE
jgi:hypothetical protein